MNIIHETLMNNADKYDLMHERVGKFWRLRKTVLDKIVKKNLIRSTLRQGSGYLKKKTVLLRMRVHRNDFKIWNVYV